MSRMNLRTKLLYLLPLLLILALGFFLFEYFTDGGRWAGHYASPYSDAGLGRGMIMDRSGVILLDTTGDHDLYSEDTTTRMSTLHILGDRTGAIFAPALSEYASALSGFNPITGLYSRENSDIGVAMLTIDSRIQNAALKALDGRRGTVAVYNYETGEILCAVTGPTYDPDNVPDIEGDTTGRYEGAYLNRFTQVTYTPGSIFKIVTTAAALSEIPDIETMKFTCERTMIINDSEIRCEGYHKSVTLKEALMYSCNCAFAQVANLLGSATLQKYAEQFDLTLPVVFDGIETASGSFDVSDGDPVATAWAAIGQSTDQICAARYLQFMGQIAGGGTAAKPYLVKSAESGFFHSYKASTSQTKRVLTTEVAVKLQEMMHYNVTENYGAERFPDIGVCAKTGTAEKGGGETANATFAGYCTDPKFPLAFICIVEDGGSGRSTCVPIMSQVLWTCYEVLK